MLRKLLLTLGLICVCSSSLLAQRQVILADVPDYDWDYGSFGTACGNLMGYWDRHGLPDFYAGPTAGGLAPLDSLDVNNGVRSMWASQAGFDGRPADKPGHVDDYWDIPPGTWGYESTAPDPYLTAGRAEHPPDCIGDFIGLNQNKWTNMNNECDGNINAYAFVYWDVLGNKRVNYTPPADAGSPPRDLQSGLREWTQYRGYEADVFTQLTEFNPTIPSGKGFTFQSLKAEIDAGYPVLLFLQDFNTLSRSLSGPPAMVRANPESHGMLACGYEEDGLGSGSVYYHTSWHNGVHIKKWDADVWEGLLPLRGVIGYHPLPKITSVSLSNQFVTVTWDGPSSVITNLVSRTSTNVNWYVLQRSTSLAAGSFADASPPTAQRQATVTWCCAGPEFFRVRLLPPGGRPSAGI